MYIVVWAVGAISKTH